MKEFQFNKDGSSTILLDEKSLHGVLGFETLVNRPFWLDEVVAFAGLDVENLRQKTKEMESKFEHDKLSVLVSSRYIKELEASKFLIHCAYLVGSSASGKVDLTRVENQGKVEVVQNNKFEVDKLKLTSKDSPFLGWRQSDVDLEVLLEKESFSDRTIANKCLIKTFSDMNLFRFPLYAVINNYDEFVDYLRYPNAESVNYVYMRTLLTPVLPLRGESRLLDIRKTVSNLISDEIKNKHLEIQDYPCVKLARGYMSWKKLEKEASGFEINNERFVNLNNSTDIDLKFYATNRIYQSLMPSKPIYIDGKSYVSYFRNLSKEHTLNDKKYENICPPPFYTFSPNLHLGQMLSMVSSDILSKVTSAKGFLPRFIPHGPFWDKSQVDISSESDKNKNSQIKELVRLGVQTENLNENESGRDNLLVQTIYKHLFSNGFIDVDEGNISLNLSRMARLINIQDLEKRLNVYPERKKEAVLATINEIVFKETKTTLNGGGKFSISIPEFIDQTFYPLFIHLCLANSVNGKYAGPNNIITGVNTYPRWLVDNILLSETLGYRGEYNAYLYNLVSDAKDKKIDRKNNNSLNLSNIEEVIRNNYTIRKPEDEKWLSKHMPSMLRYFLVNQLKSSKDKARIDFEILKKGFGLIKKIEWLNTIYIKNNPDLKKDTTLFDTNMISILKHGEFRMCLLQCQDEVYNIAGNVQRHEFNIEDSTRFHSVYRVLKLILPTI
ncbi:MAG: hypothetical protein ACD_19C00432G0014 [uncultured bacterium]|nr:MAG: hypothetical protein ACD_19C00432G0014 [uncultured bacterium]